MSDAVRIFTRRELFDLVWSKPTQTIAQELGISDRGLAKICIRHDVPNPSRGYWARIRAGQKIPPPLFREINNPALDRIQIVSAVGNLPDETREMLQKAKAESAEQKKGVPKNLIDPAEPLKKPHRFITATAKELLKAKPDRWGAISAVGDGMCGVTVHKNRAQRTVTFLHALTTKLEADKLLLQPNGNNMMVTVGSDKVSFTLIERTQRQKHIPTKEEEALYNQQQIRRQRAADRQNWELYRTLPYEKPWPDHDIIYTGELIFQFVAWHNGFRKTWSDGKMQSVESMFESIVACIKAILIFEKERRQQREDDERKRVDLERRYGLAKKRKEREDRRVAYLRELVQLQREAGEIRAWLATVPHGAEEESSTELGRMLIWANERLLDLDERTTIKAAATQFEELALFPEVDDLHDPLGEPPARRYPW
ncbi:hypothetical protein ACELLULO517_27420 [Acidisoma cellulosilytica]|uniref:Uncharacterized protein n=1 Tax=Acidisoma cellulosilyticum TaxID=2802395 RepID=A0A964E7H1_9PROT|nr:hypothetical protein [Acidisoma cellulosilyticum]MCB8883998.1 hypothetical protein [Acidisoma cellulosilyticum]